jgi:hypothetical protein
VLCLEHNAECKPQVQAVPTKQQRALRETPVKVRDLKQESTRSCCCCCCTAQHAAQQHRARTRRQARKTSLSAYVEVATCARALHARSAQGSACICIPIITTPQAQSTVYTTVHGAHLDGSCITIFVHEPIHRCVVLLLRAECLRLQQTTTP